MVIWAYRIAQTKAVDCLAAIENTKIGIPMSDELEKRTLDAHEQLWTRITELNNLPHPYGTALGLLPIFRLEELERFQNEPSCQFLIEDEEFLQLSNADKSLELIRPYIDSELWIIAKARTTFTFRLLVLIAKDSPASADLSQWHEDKILKQQMLANFPETTVKSFDYSKLATISEITKVWDDQILAKIKDGCRGLDS